MFAQTFYHLVLGEQQRLQGGNVVGQVGWAEYAPSLREPCNVYKAEVGFQVRSGRRQSMPSSSVDSCAWVSATEPLLACGQMKRPRSSRLACKHKPSPLHHSNLIRSLRRPRNTNTWPLNGSSSSAVCTLAARPLKPERMLVVPAASHTLVPAGSPMIAAPIQHLVKPGRVGLTLDVDADFAQF